MSYNASGTTNTPSNDYEAQLKKERENAWAQYYATLNQQQQKIDAQNGANPPPPIPVSAFSGPNNSGDVNNASLQPTPYMSNYSNYNPGQMQLNTNNYGPTNDFTNRRVFNEPIRGGQLPGGNENANRYENGTNLYGDSNTEYNINRDEGRNEENRGSFDTNRREFDGVRGEFNTNRGGFDTRRREFNASRGGYNTSRGGFRSDRGGRGGFSYDRGGYEGNGRGGFNNTEYGANSQENRNGFNRGGYRSGFNREQGRGRFNGGESERGGFRGGYEGRNGKEDGGYRGRSNRPFGRGIHQDRNDRAGFSKPQGSEEELVELKETVFIQNIPKNANEKYISDVFASAGEIGTNFKTGQPRIKIYTDRATGEPKGECMITFTTAENAQRCIELYNGQSFPGSELSMKLSIAKFKNTSGRGENNGFRGSYRGTGFRGRGGYQDNDRGQVRNRGVDRHRPY